MRLVSVVLPGILSIQAKYMGLFAIDMVLAIVIPFVLTFIFRRVGFLTKAEDEVKSDEKFTSSGSC
jgi:PTS system trehalose-specific IIC component